jgi:hypothetical protein
MRGLLALALVLVAGVAYGGSRFAYEPAAVATMRAYQYAAASEELCLAELAERGVPFERVPEKRGVETPLRITGPVRGVTYVPTYRAEPDPEGPAAILDCRLALAVDDLSQVLAARGVVEAEYLSLYRPGPRKRGVRHAAGRAIDLAVVKLADGTSWSVEHHFFGRPGSQTCGLGAKRPRKDHPGARFWREVVCELDAMRSFNLILSPNFDRGHHDHLHLEVRSGIRWFLIQ